MHSGFAIILDGCAHPAAVFRELEDAIAWGVQRFPGGGYVIRHLRLLRTERD